jgi:hypothetical protein
MHTRELATTSTAAEAPATPEHWDEDGSFSAALVVAAFIGLTTAGLIASAAIF